MNLTQSLRVATALSLGAASLTAQVGSFVTDGQGCPSTEEIGAAVYELFSAGDLAGSSLTFTRVADGYTITSGPLSFVGGFSNDLNLSEDQITTVFLSQPFPVAVVGDLTQIVIDSNGRFGQFPSSSGTEMVDALINNTALQFCPWWDDLSPDDGGGVFFDTIGGVDVITWNQVPQMIAGDDNTFQVQLFPNGDMIWSYMTGCDDDGLVGFSTGGPVADNGPVDFSAGGPISVVTLAPPSLSSLQIPEVANPLSIVVNDLPTLSFLTAVNLGVNPSSIDLGTLGAPGCTLLVDPVASFPTPMNQLDLSIPANPALAGGQILFQAISFAPGANALNVIVSNRGTATIAGQPTIEVLASGANSFNGDPSSGFWSIENVTAQPITSVVFDFSASTNPNAAGLEFDTNQDGTNFSDGNGTAAACDGTYRNNSDVLSGLVFAGTDPSDCDGTAQIGAIRTNPVPGDLGSFRRIRWDFTNFVQGTLFEVDIDTDGPASATQNGADIAGMVVTITLQDGTILSGEMFVDGPETAAIRF
ncbi:MAG: hypothetical protein AAF196_12125 [Planctomycetota bacterium]